MILYRFESYITGPHTDQGITDYQYAIWNLFKPGVPNSASPEMADGNSLTIQQQAYTDVLNNTTSAQAAESELVIYTPSPSASPNQEFLGLDTPTPEPATGALLAGVFGLALIARRRQKAA